MIDWLAVPSFGSPHAAFATVIRPSAYAVVLDARRGLAVVAAPGGFYLPGGGCTETEAPEAAAIREAQEECGLTLEVGKWRRAAIEYVTAESERAHYAKQSVFCDARVVGPPRDGAEADHQLRWLSPVQALTDLGPASHRWAVSEWMRDHRTPLPPSRSGDG